MELLVQTAGSLVAILALAALAWWMKLGGAPGLDGEAAVYQSAAEVDDGFDPVSAAASRDGMAALARDGSGRIMVIKRHGNRFAGRILGPAARAQTDGARLAVVTGEARFGTVMLDLAAPQAWADAINRVEGRQDA